MKGADFVRKVRRLGKHRGAPVDLVAERLRLEDLS
jgi:hypothetical protein